MDLPAESTTRPAASNPAADVHGLTDNASPDRLYGWAVDSSRPGHRLALELRLGGQVVARTVADLPRPDLVENDIGDGCHGFEFPVPPELMVRVTEMTVVALGASGAEATIPMRLRRLPPRPAPAAPPSARPVENQRQREEMAALAKRLAELPDSKLLQALPAQQAALAQQFQALARSMEQRMAALPTPEQMAQWATQQNLLVEQVNGFGAAVDHRLADIPGAAEMEQLAAQQAQLVERMVALETWLARMDHHLAAAPAARAAASQPPRSIDLWQKVLFGGLVVALSGALVISLMLRG